jgi:RNA polymerase sigma-70 factor (sigma-E family)
MDLLGSRRHSPDFEAFVEMHATRLLRSAYFLTRDRGAAEDLVQSTLLETFTHWPKARESPAAYANRVLANLNRDRWRRQATGRRHQQGEEERERLNSARRDPDPTSGQIESQLERTTMLEVINSLPDRQREVLVLRFYLDQSVPEIAEALRIPEGTVKSSLSRAIARMRHLLLPVQCSPIHGDT